jgi:ankyrin repeat protein/gamma-glutamyl-gamma-aminobutyrate hydrolase PuuD
MRLLESLAISLDSVLLYKLAMWADEKYNSSEYSLNYSISIDFSEAAAKGSINILSFLIENYKDNLREKTIQLGFNEAAKNGHLDILYYLLLYCDSSIGYYNKNISFEGAAKNGHLEIVFFLLEKCGNDIKNHNKENAFEGAAENGHTEVVSFLLKKCGNAISNSSKEIALRWAANNGRKETVTFLLEKLGKDISNKAKDDAFKLAADNEHIEVVSLFLKEFNNDISNEAKDTAFKDAARFNRIKTLEVLLNNCADSISDKAKDEAFEYAAINFTHKEIVSLLLEKIGNSISNQAKDTAFKDAIEHVKIELIELYLSKDFAVPSNLLSNKILSAAITKGKIELTNFLLGKGVVPTDEDLYLAVKNGHTALSNLIKEKYNIELDVNKLFHLALKDKDIDLVEKSFMQGAEIKETIIGISNILGQWSGPVLSVAEEAMRKEENIYFLPIAAKHVANEKFISQFSGFINPGAMDSFPRDREFQLKDLDKSKMLSNEHLYQAVLDISNKYHIPYFGICSGSQHLILNHEGYLNRTPGYLGGNHKAHFIHGTIPYFLSLDENEQEKALSECVMPEVTFPISTAHNFAGVNGKIATLKLAAVSEEGVVESFSKGARQIGTQFHPEQYYFSSYDNYGPNRQKLIIDHFFEICKEHRHAINYAKENGISQEEMLSRIQKADELLLTKLETCRAKAISLPKNDLELIFAAEQQKEICLAQDNFRKEYFAIIEKGVEEVAVLGVLEE